MVSYVVTVYHRGNIALVLFVRMRYARTYTSNVTAYVTLHSLVLIIAEPKQVEGDPLPAGGAVGPFNPTRLIACVGQVIVWCR